VAGAANDQQLATVFRGAEDLTPHSHGNDEIVIAVSDPDWHGQRAHAIDGVEMDA
jgi:hypothetical protein